jgi:hypothetical protein
MTAAKTGQKQPSYVWLDGQDQLTQIKGHDLAMTAVL